MGTEVRSVMELRNIVERLLASKRPSSKMRQEASDVCAELLARLAESKDTTERLRIKTWIADVSKKYL